MRENIMPKIPDGEHLLESANDSARHFRNVYLAYLTVMIYIFVIVLSTEQELLFRAGDKQLPLVHINVPIVAFFTWIPWALLVLHFYLLIQVKFLSDKVRLYNERLNNHLESEEDISDAQMLLASVPLVHILVEKKGKSMYSTLLYLIVFVSLVVFPLIVLIVTQIAFLPYQSELTTWVHRIVILIDVFMLWALGRNILRSHEGKTIWINSVAGLLVVLVAVFVVIVVFINFPGSKIYSHATASLYELEWVKKIMPANRFVLLNRKLVEREPAPELLAAELLAAQIKYQMDDENLIKNAAPIWCRYTDPLDLKDRNFRKAKLERATLCKANLQDANLTDADLGGADLTDAYLWRADLTDANLREANLTDADLGGADLIDANLREANLTDAVLWRADLTDANLRKADLTDAVLWRANLTDADLWGADLTAVNLSQADFSNAVLGGTTLDLTWVWESSGSDEERYFPIGIPKDWDDTLKPEYLCPEDFDTLSYYDISEYINEDGEVEQEKLKDQLREIIEENCKPYNP